MDYRGKYQFTRRTPQGVRGLKLSGGWVRDMQRKSHSARSAWIETGSSWVTIPQTSVALRKECVD